jgi:hypothetical protein
MSFKFSNKLFLHNNKLQDEEDESYLEKPINIICKKVCLFANARDEKNIKEWAAHHLLLGFNKIIIFDHKSQIPLKNIFLNFDNRVEIIDVSHLKNPIKIQLMTSASVIAKRLEMDWMIYLDADEFLTLNKKYFGVKHLLSEFNHADALSINWLMFGSNLLEKDPNGLVIDNYTRSNLYLNDHVKTFVRPNRIVRAINPHFYIMKNSNRTFGINNKLIVKDYYKNNIKVTFHQAPAYIAHYVNQSEETFIKRKILLPSDDTGENRNLIDYDIKNIHTQFNDVENNEVKNKYSKKIHLFLEKYNIS